MRRPPPGRLANVGFDSNYEFFSPPPTWSLIDRADFPESPRPAWPGSIGCPSAVPPEPMGRIRGNRPGGLPELPGRRPPAPAGGVERNPTFVGRFYNPLLA